MGFVGPNTLKHFVQKYFGDYKKIKDIGDGTVTDAISTINNSLQQTSRILYTSERNTISITPEFDCNVLIVFSMNTWGYGGELYTAKIVQDNNDSHKLENIFTTIPAVQGGDQVNKNITIHLIAGGLKKGNKYTFRLEDVIGNQGTNNNRIWLILYVRS